MKLDVTKEEFNAYSNEKKKKYIANLIIRTSGAVPVDKYEPPFAIVMAGLPGAGKTEFLDAFSELIVKNGSFKPFVRIDLDQLVTVYPNYTAKDYYKFRSDGNRALARCVDEARHGRYNMMIDGTFSGKSGASIDGIGRMLDDGYIVQLFYMHDRAETAYEYTKKREEKTNRGIDEKGFKEACRQIPLNLIKARELYGKNRKFHLSVVVQKELRDKNYSITTSDNEIDNILRKGYTFSND